MLARSQWKVIAEFMILFLREQMLKNYDISYKPGQLTINPALLTLKVNDISREYGDVNPAFTFYCIGIKGEQTVADALSEQPTLVTSATEASNVGQYSVLISGGKSKNYQLSYQSGLLTVNKAPLTVVAENAEKTLWRYESVFLAFISWI